MNTLYIKDHLIKSRNQIILIIDDHQIINPTHEMLINNGWKPYTQTQPTEEQIFEDNKQKYIQIIFNYDSSDSVNKFFIGDLPMWLDKSTRAGLLLRFQAEKSKGWTMTTLWYNNMQFPLNIDMAIEMLYTIEIYASACYDKTQRHLSEIKRLTTLQEIESYNYKEGYPEILYFQL